MKWVLLDANRPGNDCEACNYRVARRVRCKECGKLTCGYCEGIYHCPSTINEGPDGDEPA